MLILICAMSERQIMIKIKKMSEDISFEDIVETLNLINGLRSRIDNFDRNKALATEELKKEMQAW